jgi:hypothetical protein
MNKISCTLIIITTFCGILTAQEPEGKYSLELNVNPAALFDAAAGSMFQMPEIKARYFLSSDVALRMGLELAFDNDKSYSDSQGNDYTKYTDTDITFLPGIEKEFGTGKFKAYFGGELPLEFSSSSREVKVGDDITKTSNPDGDSYFGIGLSAVFGFDYYILGNLFIGAELSPGLMFYKNSDTKTGNTITTKGGSELSFDLSSSSGIRLGVRF